MLIHARQLPRETRDVLFTLAVVAWLVATQAPFLPPWCTASMLVLLLWRAWLAHGARPLPHRVLLLVLLLAITGGIYAQFKTLFGPEAGAAFVLMLLVLKTLEMRARRDAMIIFFLGFFTLLTGLFQSQSLLSAAVMLVGLLGLMTALVNAHQPMADTPLSASARTAGVMMLTGAPIMLALFVFFPRFEPLWGVPNPEGTGKTGLSSTMEVGQVAELALDHSVAMRIRFDEAPPPQEVLYFRGPVLSYFDGRQWKASRGSTARDPGFIGAAPADLQTHGPAIAYTATLEPNQQNWLLALDATPQAPQLPGSWRIRQGSDLQWYVNRPISRLLRYRAEGYTQFSYGRASTDGRYKPYLSPFLQLPEGSNPRTRALAKELQQGARGNTRAVVQQALQSLRDGGYSYTLEPGPYGRETADEFWFDRKQGFCEHIASAFVVLMRSADIPARVVTGFQGGELNDVDGYWLVRNSDAHAWAEVWLEDVGWQRVDPTAAISPDRISADLRLRSAPGLIGSAMARLSPRLLVRAQLMWEALNNRWDQLILTYTEDQQLNLLRKLGFGQPSWIDMVRILGLLVMASALAASGLLLWQRQQHDPWLALLNRVQHRMAAVGLPSRPHTTPRQLQRLLARDDVHPDLDKSALANWLAAMERFRYAPTGTETGVKLHALQRQYRRIRWPRRKP